MKSDSVLSFGITMDQAKKICDYYGKDINKLEGYEVCELLDKLIAKLKELGVVSPIKTVEVVDMDELENVIYNGWLDASELTNCKQVKEIPTLKVTKKKGE